MTFAVFVPPQAKDGPMPVLWYLSGLTAELGLIVVCPDTSPGGEGVADDKNNCQFGSGAGFYVEVTPEPFARVSRLRRSCAYDRTLLIEVGKRFPEFLVDQGWADGFLQEGLRPWLLEDACKKAGIGHSPCASSKIATIPTISSRP